MSQTTLFGETLPQLSPEELEAEHETEHLGDIPGCPACLAERRRIEVR